MNDSSVRIWVDRRWGPWGLWVWAMLAGWFAAIRGAYVISVAENVPILAKVITLPIAIFIVLVGAASLFSVWPATAYRVGISKDSNCSVWLYYFRRISFPLKRVNDIQELNIGGIKSWLTPLRADGGNYKVSLTNGKVFYISGHTKEVDSLIRRINGD